MIETVFVTGGSSTLGQRVLRRLTSHFHVLAVVHRHNVEIPDAEIELLRGGLEETVRNPQTLQRAQVVLHMAAVTHADDPAEYFHVNTELTKQLVSACSASQHFIYVSTICAHPDGGAYGRSKWLAEEAIRGSRLDYTIIRPSEIYGSKDAEGIDALIAVARKVRILPDFRYGGQSSMRRSARRKLRTLLRRQQFIAVRREKLTLFALIVYAPLPRWPERSAAPCVLSL